MKWGPLHGVRHDMISLMFYRVARVTLAVGFRIDCKGGGHPGSKQEDPLRAEKIAQI